MKFLWIECCIRSCEFVVQILFWLKKMFCVIVFVVVFRLGVLVNIICGFLLLYFSQICFRLDCFEYCSSFVFVVVELVKVSMFIFMCRVNGLLMCVLCFGSMFSMFFGRFVLVVSVVSCNVFKGECLDGLSIIELFMVNVGVIFQQVISSGKFYGMIVVMILVVLCVISFSLCGLVGVILLYSLLMVLVVQCRQCIVFGRLMWCVLCIGLFMFRVFSRVSLLVCVFISVVSVNSMCFCWVGLVCDQWLVLKLCCVVIIVCFMFCVLQLVIVFSM